MTKHISEWKDKPDILLASWQEIYLLYFVKKANINRERNNIVLILKKDHYQRIIRLPKWMK